MLNHPGKLKYYMNKSKFTNWGQKDKGEEIKDSDGFGHQDNNNNNIGEVHISLIKRSHLN